MFKNTLIAMTALLMSSSLLAGTAKLETGGSITTMEYRGAGLLRMSGQYDGYMLHRDGKLFMVSGPPGRQMVIDAAAAFKMAGGMMPATGPNPVKLNSFSNSGRSETVAGIPGEVWDINYQDEKGNTQQRELVLSKDSRAREYSEAMYQMTRTMFRITGKDPAQAEVLSKELRDKGLGILRFGSEMKVLDLSGNDVPESRFALPSAPMQMPNFGNFQLQR